MLKTYKTEKNRKHGEQNKKGATAKAATPNKKNVRLLTHEVRS